MVGEKHTGHASCVGVSGNNGEEVCSDSFAGVGVSGNNGEDGAEAAPSEGGISGDEGNGGDDEGKGDEGKARGDDGRIEGEEKPVGDKLPIDRTGDDDPEMRDDRGVRSDKSSSCATSPTAADNFAA
ncbi:hypothetical protein EUX98_g8919 [Antrodiella citrinella]|uniref:Uncharacterized protein n=1 Tax=Antrodiella citrinella TaxID=2447956 RepID=A0A4S4M2T6_9APHY|nr:hypothetical protein EUX98_g8919 [Antrodiella citrinella]